MGNPLRVAVIGSLDIECMGGGEANTIMFANIMSNMGYNVTYFGSGCTGSKGPTAGNGTKMLFNYRPSSFRHDPMAHPKVLQISRLLSMGLIGLFGFRKTKRILEGFDIYYFANPTVLSRRIIPKVIAQGKRVIIANHGTFFEYLGNSSNWILRVAGELAGKMLLEPLKIYGDGITVHTQNSFQTEYYRKMGFDSRNIMEAPQHNIDFSRYSIAPVREGFFVAFLGRLTESKGINLLIDVANMNPQMVFHVMGMGHMMREINSVPKYNNIIAHGFVQDDDKRKILASCDAMIVPSMFESLSIASIEGLASGLPLVASQTAQGIRYIISKDSIFGKLLPRDAESFSVELRRLMRRKEEAYSEYLLERENIRESAMKKFDEKSLLNNLIKIAKCNINSEDLKERKFPDITTYF